MTHLPVKKIYVDSRYRTADSVSDSNFKIQLGRNIYLPERCVMRIDHCVIPHSWYTIEHDMNDKMYFVIETSTSTGCYTITIPSTNYVGSTLASTLQTLFNAILPGKLSVNYTVAINAIAITTTFGVAGFLYVLTDAQLATKWGGRWSGPEYDPNNHNSCNDIITNRTASRTDLTWYSGCINVQGFRAVYLSSSNLTNYNTLGSRGENDIIKKISTTSDFGYLIIEQGLSHDDYLSCERTTLNTIDFRICDARGNEIPFHDSPVSFTIYFDINQ